MCSKKSKNLLQSLTPAASFVLLLCNPVIMLKKVTSLLLVSAAALCMTGCDRERAHIAPREANVLGIVHVQEDAYTHTGANTFALSTDEVVSRKNFSGNKATLFWGLITLKDY